MHALGFNNKWCDLIYRLISNCWYSVLWDGSSFGHFKSFQGVRQGDPISPSLFIISTECLSRLLKQRINEGYILPYFVKVGALHVMLVFTNSSKASLTRLMELFNNLCAWSGQQLNAGKSSLFLDKNVSPQRRRTILDITGFTSGSFPTTYLGAPLFSRRVKIEYFSALEEKVRRGIGEWVRKFIYMAGRVTIIEVVLNSTLIHTLASLPRHRPSLIVFLACSVVSFGIRMQIADIIGLVGETCVDQRLQEASVLPISRLSRCLSSISWHGTA
ncbi:hypothetical protein QQ045_028255 [Rhodiola kirilowii]